MRGGAIGEADRCGAEPGVALARHVAAQPGLRFAGLQAYQGRAQHIREIEKRREAIAEAVDRVRRTIEGLRAAGLPCEIVSGAGTGTFRFETESGVYTELQAGSYAFMFQWVPPRSAPPWVPAGARAVSAGSGLGVFVSSLPAVGRGVLRRSIRRIQ